VPAHCLGPQSAMWRAELHGQRITKSAETVDAIRVRKHAQINTVACRFSLEICDSASIGTGHCGPRILELIINICIHHDRWI